MLTTTDPDILQSKLERVAGVLRVAGWLGFWIQLILAAAAGLMLVLAFSGRTFNQAISPATGTVSGVGTEVAAQTTPGIGIGMVLAGCGILVLLFNAFLAFRQTQFSKALRRHNPEVHPRKQDVTQVLRLGALVGLIGMLITILGGGATLGVLLSKSIAQPQGVAIYDPNRIIRSLDIFAAMANMIGITGHYIGTIAPLSLLNWLHRQ